MPYYIVCVELEKGKEWITYLGRQRGLPECRYTLVLQTGLNVPVGPSD